MSRREGMPRRKDWVTRVQDHRRANTLINGGNLIVGILMLVVGTGVGVTWWEPLRTLLRVGVSTEAAAYNRVREALRETREELAAANGLLAEARESLAYSERLVGLLDGELERARGELRRARGEIEALATLGECVHDRENRRPPRSLTSVADCTIEAQLRWEREIRFYGRRSPIRVGDSIVLAVVPDMMETDSFIYQWDMRGCWSGQINGATTGPILGFTMVRTDSPCRIDLHDGHDVYRLSYRASY